MILYSSLPMRMVSVIAYYDNIEGKLICFTDFSTSIIPLHMHESVINSLYFPFLSQYQMLLRI